MRWIMATSNQLTVTTTPQRVHSASERQVSLWVHTAATMYFGGDSSVSSSNGFRLDANDKYQMIIPAGNEVWVVAGSGSQKLYVFAVEI